MALLIKASSSVPMLLMLMFMFMFPISSSYAYNTCPPLMNHPLFMFDFKAQCPTNIIYSSPIQMDGESLDKALSSSQTNAYVAILFYASWCPFSKSVQPKFDALSSMYPQIKHIMVEQSSVLPIVFSRYGIHSVPSILLVNKTTRMRHRGPKEMQSLVDFYQRATGLEPTMYLTEDQIIFSENKSDVLESLNKTQIKDLISRELYLTFSLFFLFIKALVYFYPNMISNLIALWLAYIPHPNLAIFGESKQLLARVLHLVDVNRAFNKLKLINSRPFHNGARSARAWTSSLASFSLSKTSSSRASQGVKAVDY